jgi:hypothetical protein
VWCCFQIEIGIAQAALEIINIEEVIWLAIFAIVCKKFVVIIGKIEIFIIVTSI